MKWLPLLLSALTCFGQGLTLRDATYPPLLRGSDSSSASLTVTNDLILWMKSDAITNQVDNSDVVYWPDSSTNNRPAIVGAGVAPIFKLNQRGALPGVDFNGSTMGMNSIFSDPSNTVSMFAVFRLDTTNGIQTIFRTGENGGYGLLASGGLREVLHRSIAACDDGAVTNVVEMWSTVRTDAPLEQLWVNGVAQSLSNSGSGCNPPESIYYIGYFGVAGFFMDGQIYEILLYSRPLPDGERQSVQAYLTSKWGL